MKTETPARAPRMSADERREEVLTAAVAEFALYGLHGASTEAIAARAGISQPYIFRLFGTKKDLFIAAARRVCGRIRTSFHEAAALDGADDPLHAMGHAYMDLLARREEFLMLLQAYAAAGDRDVQRIVRGEFEEIIRTIERKSGAGEVEVESFIAMGMLLMIATALEMPIAHRKEVCDPLPARRDGAEPASAG